MKSIRNVSVVFLNGYEFIFGYICFIFIAVGDLLIKNRSWDSIFWFITAIFVYLSRARNHDFYRCMLWSFCSQGFEL